jgi:signal transduction histidine kinase
MIEKSGLLAKKELDFQKQLLESSILTKENEMRRISQELHDALGSEINALRFHIHNADMESDLKEELNSECINISKSIRRISEELMPITLEKLGLKAATENLMDQIRKASFIKLNAFFECNNPFVLGDKAALSFFRIIQELFNNILKHNNAHTIAFFYLHDDNKLEITIKDDGFFFDPKVKLRQNLHGHGLFNIESRLQLINASISFYENKPSGTIVSVKLNRLCSEE